VPKNASSVWPPALAAALLGGLGLALYFQGAGDGLDRLSYDLPFLPRGKLAAPEVALVYVDDESGAALGQPPDRPWDRALHARLVERLTAEGARAVLFDIIFDSPGPDPAVDARLAAALRAQGKVVLSAEVEVAESGDAATQIVSGPVAELRRAAAGWGLASLEPDADRGVRHLFPGTGGILASTEVLARLLGKGAGEGTASRWLNYYGPPDWLSGVSYERALRPDGVPPGFFADKIVLVGGRPTAKQPGEGRDEFAGPYTRWGRRFYPGVEIHATALLNRLHHTWLERLRPVWEIAILLAAGIFAGVLLPALRPWQAALTGLGGAGSIAAVSVLGVWKTQVWWAWLIPAGVQIPCGVVWAIGSQYFAEARRRQALRRAFSLYLSPHMAEKIAATEFDLKPGGQLVEATMMFTDLAGFTALAEELRDPAALSALLIRYYTRTTACLLEQDGTIIKYMGDAVEAVWNAPVPDPAHALKACRAADRLRAVARFEANGRTMMTRVGIHTGPAFAGNLGSEFRFDYAVIGDTTNFASRLEALNKRFGTEILLSEATLAQTRGAFLTRPLGRIRVAGKMQPVAIHELLGESSPEENWLTAFRAGQLAFEQGDLATARAALEQARAERPGGDGPSGYLLGKMREFAEAGAPSPWTGVLEFASK
jgi:adenylate cyclase